MTDAGIEVTTSKNHTLDSATVPQGNSFLFLARWQSDHLTQMTIERPTFVAFKVACGSLALEAHWSDHSHEVFCFWIKFFLRAFSGRLL